MLVPAVIRLQRVSHIVPCNADSLNVLPNDVCGAAAYGINDCVREILKEKSLKSDPSQANDLTPAKPRWDGRSTD